MGGRRRRARGTGLDSSPAMVAADDSIQWVAASAPDPIGIEREGARGGRSGALGRLQSSVGPDSACGGIAIGSSGPARWEAHGERGEVTWRHPIGRGEQMVPSGGTTAGKELVATSGVGGAGMRGN